MTTEQDLTHFLVKTVEDYRAKAYPHRSPKSWCNFLGFEQLAEDRVPFHVQGPAGVLNGYAARKFETWPSRKDIEDVMDEAVNDLKTKVSNIRNLSTTGGCYNPSIVGPISWEYPITAIGIQPNTQLDLRVRVLKVDTTLHLAAFATFDSPREDPYTKQKVGYVPNVGLALGCNNRSKKLSELPVEEQQREKQRPYRDKWQRYITEDLL